MRPESVLTDERLREAAVLCRDQARVQLEASARSTRGMVEHNAAA